MLRIKKLLVLVVIISIIFTLASVMSAWTTSDPGYSLEYARSNDNVLPEYVDEPNTPDSMTGFSFFKQNYNEDGFVLGSTENGPVKFTFNVNPSDPSQKVEVWLAKDSEGVVYIYRWDAINISIYYFMAKGGSNYLVYTYDGTNNSDGHLYSPKNNNSIANLSHFTIFYKNGSTGDSSTTQGVTTTTTPEVTTTQEVTTTTTPEVTTTQEVTTTTTPEVTTTQEVTTTTTPEVTTTQEVTTTTTPEVTTTQEVTTTNTAPSEETVTATTTSEESSEVILTDPSIPGASVTTTTTTTIGDEDIPQTGESGNAALIGTILLALAASLTLIVYRSKASEKQ